MLKLKNAVNVYIYYSILFEKPAKKIRSQDLHYDISQFIDRIISSHFFYSMWSMKKSNYLLNSRCIRNALFQSNAVPKDASTTCSRQFGTYKIIQSPKQVGQATANK